MFLKKKKTGNKQQKCSAGRFEGWTFLFGNHWGDC